MEREKITFCPHCGVQLKLKDKELENDFIQCTECKQLIKKCDIDYYFVDEEDDNEMLQFLRNNQFYVILPEIFENYNIKDFSISSVENLEHNRVRFDVKVITNNKKNDYVYPNIKDITSIKDILNKQNFTDITVLISDYTGNVVLQETYNNVKFLYCKRSSILSYDDNKPLTFGLYFSFQDITYKDIQKNINRDLISE